MLICAGVLCSAALAFGAAARALAGGALVSPGEWFFLDALSAYHLDDHDDRLLAQLALHAELFPRAKLEAGAFTPRLARRFGALWFGALAAMTLVLVSNNLGIMWVGIEATTLVTAFLICLHRSPASLEAMWKYLIICSVGVAFAFMGTLLVGASTARQLPAGRRAALDEALRRRRRAQPGAAQGGVPVPAGRLRHEGRPGADAQLAARRAQPGARAGLGAVLAGSC